jgi:hypothetical protein
LQEIYQPYKRRAEIVIADLLLVYTYRGAQVWWASLLAYTADSLVKHVKLFVLKSLSYYIPKAQAATL